MDPQLDRRQFVRVGLYGTALLLVPVGCGDSEEAALRPSEGRYFDGHQYETVEALTGMIIPEGKDPGAVTARVADYIDFLLGAFKVNPPRIYATGPYSGRRGGENGFDDYLPLSRVKEIGWRNTIEGSQGIAEREFNGPVKGLQQIYTEGIEALDALARELHQSDVKDLGPLQRRLIFREADEAFRNIVFEHTVEGMYAAPEYGGNADLVGWENIHYEGDRQPIGYTRKEVEEPDEEQPGVVLSSAEVEEVGRKLRARLFSRKHSAE